MNPRESLLPAAVLLAFAACTPLSPSPPRQAPPRQAPPRQAPPRPAPPAEAAAEAPGPGEERVFTIVAVNDVYRIEGVDEGRLGGIARLRTLRVELEREAPDLLFLHAGDLLFPSFLSRSYMGEQMIDMLNRLDGDAEAFDRRMFITFGNHEFDKKKLGDAAMLDRRVEESGFTWLDSDIDWTVAEDGRPLVAGDNLIASTIVESGGVKVGLFSLTTDFEHPAYVHCFGQPKAVARRLTADLRRRGAEVVVALTHLRMAQDEDLLCGLGGDGPDLVIGGHEHNRQSADACGRLVIKADAEAVTATVARVTVGGQGPPEVDFEFRQLDDGIASDPSVQTAVDAWLTRHEEEYCAELVEKGELRPEEEEGCLSASFGTTAVELIGEELELRRFETNLGNWTVDQALAHFDVQGPVAGQPVLAALINSGSLRLNQNIPPGEVTRLHVEEIFQYSTELRVLRLTGAVLQQAVSHAVTDWTGNGKWLQISGFAFRHDPVRGTADRLTLLGPEGARAIEPDEELLVVTSDYLADPATGQDGFTMFTADMVVPSGREIDLKDLVIQGLQEAYAHGEGIAPRVEGRICNTERGGPCLAVER